MPDARSPRSRKSWDSCSFIELPHMLSVFHGKTDGAFAAPSLRRLPPALCPCLSMPEGWQRSRNASCMRITYPGRLYPVL